MKNFARSLNPKKDVKAYLELKKIVKDLNPEIMHLHSSKAGALGRLLFSTRKYKMFYTPHGYSFLMEDISENKKRIYKYIEKLCGKKNCMTVACGVGEWEESRKVTNKSIHISNGVNTDKIDTILSKSKDKKESSDFVVYTVGRINYQKNPELFNEIAELLPNVKFLWVGDGDMKSVLTSPNITITGWKDGKGALQEAIKGTVFMLPSRWEGLPISLLEAMYMKKPCIVSNVVGNRDIIHNDDTGYVCNTPEEFAQVIEKLQKEIDNTLIENAYSKIINHYNSKMLCQRYAKLYLE